jgi:enoyl-[acyl-carrier protein] reductase III
VPDEKATTEQRSIKDKVVLITGGTRGIGRAIALRLAAEKTRHIVVAYCMNHDAARRTVDDLRRTGIEASSVIVDVGDEKLMREMFRTVHDRCGRLDIFISNAARTSFCASTELSMRSWNRIMQINAGAFLLGSQLAAALMRENGGGRIIGISSLGSRFYVPMYSGLGAAKAAMESLARYLAVELAPSGINVNVVCAGLVDSDIIHLAPDSARLIEHVIARTPVHRLAQPEDIAGVVALLCSPESDWIRGQTIIADGGYSLMG